MLKEGTIWKPEESEVQARITRSSSVPCNYVCNLTVQICHDLNTYAQRSLMSRLRRISPSNNPIVNIEWRIGSKNSTPIINEESLPLIASMNPTCRIANPYAIRGAYQYSNPERNIVAVKITPNNGKNSRKLKRLPCRNRVLVLQNPYLLHILINSSGFLHSNIVKPEKRLSHLNRSNIINPCSYWAINYWFESNMMNNIRRKLPINIDYF